jgi:hypothetical protein
MRLLLAIIIAAGASGCAGPAGYGFGKTAESYRICTAAPGTPGCAAFMAPPVVFVPPPMQFRPVEFHPIETHLQRGFSCLSREQFGQIVTDCR